MRLKHREKLQGALGVVTTLTSMYLFSALGVQGDRNDTIWRIGAVGAVAIGIATLIEMFALALGRSMPSEQPAGISKEPRRVLSGASDSRSDRRLSPCKVSEEIIVGGFV